eukprot:346004_1
MSVSESIDHITFISSIIVAVIAYILAFIVWRYYDITERIWDATAKWSMCAVISYGVYCVVWAVYMRFQNKTFSSYLNHIDTIIIWRLGATSIYIMFVKRFEATFGETKYDTFPAVYICFYILCILFLLLGVVTIIMLVLLDLQSISLQQISMFGIIEAVLSSIVDIILSVGLIGLFVYKLWLLNRDIGIEYLHQNMNDNNSSLNSKQVSIVNVMSKMTILSIFATVSTQMVFVLQSIQYVRMFEDKDYDILDTFAHLLGVADCFVNSICVIWSFDFVAPCYRWTPCALFDFCCSKLCKYVIKQTVSKNLIQNQ